MGQRGAAAAFSRKSPTHCSAALDLLWLRDRYGLTFNGVDYEKIDGAAFDIDPKRTTVEDLVDSTAKRNASSKADFDVPAKL